MNREIEQVRKEAEEKFGQWIEKFIGICKELIALGANPAETVQKLRDFRGEKGRKSKKTPAELQAQLLQKLIQGKSSHTGGSLFSSRPPGGRGGLFSRPAMKSIPAAAFGAPQVFDIR